MICDIYCLLYKRPSYTATGSLTRFTDDRGDEMRYSTAIYKGCHAEQVLMSVATERARSEIDGREGE